MEKFSSTAFAIFSGGFLFAASVGIQASTFTFDFTGNSGDMNSPQSFSSLPAGETVVVTGYSRRLFDGNWVTAPLHQNSDGIGVDWRDGLLFNDDSQIDNTGRYELIQIELSDFTVPEGATLKFGGLNWLVDNYTIWASDSSSLPTVSGGSLQVSSSDILASGAGGPGFLDVAFSLSEPVDYLYFGTTLSTNPFQVDAYRLTELTVQVVPIPAAAWLFGSALVGMAGIGYRRSWAS